MFTIQFFAVVLFAAALCAGLAPKLKVPLELLLLCLSLLIGFIPGLLVYELHPDHVFLLLLPPVLFAAAYFTSWRDFKRNLRPIALLAIGLVVATVLGIGYIIHALFPFIPLSAAFLLGAIISPPDASAATAIGRQLGLPRRLLTIIEGESLVNDATALVCYKLALAAIATGQFSVPAAGLQFITVAGGGVVCGYWIAMGMLWMIEKVRSPSAESLLSIICAFLTYTVAEQFHLSGVVATVTGGLCFGRCIPRMTSAETRLEATGAWNVLLLAINSVIFAMIGLQFKKIQSVFDLYGVTDFVSIAAVVLVSLVLIRIAWIFATAHISRIIPAVRRNDPRPSAGMLLVLGWSSMRGIVSLAAALAIPVALPDGSAWPHRDLIIALTYIVIIFTLIVPSLTMPLVFRIARISGDASDLVEETTARLAMVNAAVRRLETYLAKDSADGTHAQPLIERYTLLRERIAPNLNGAGYSTLDYSDQAKRKLVMEALTAERAELINHRIGGLIHDEFFHHLSNELDLEELRTKRNLRP